MTDVIRKKTGKCITPQGTKINSHSRRQLGNLEYRQVFHMGNYVLLLQILWKQSQIGYSYSFLGHSHNCVLFLSLISSYQGKDYCIKLVKKIIRDASFDSAHQALFARSGWVMCSEFTTIDRGQELFRLCFVLRTCCGQQAKPDRGFVLH